MKKVFLLISLLAVAYLAAKTSFAQTTFAYIGNLFSSTTTNGKTTIISLDDQKLESSQTQQQELLRRLSTWELALDKSENERVKIQKKVERLEQELTNLVGKVEITITKPTATDSKFLSSPASSSLVRQADAHENAKLKNSTAAASQNEAFAQAPNYEDPREKLIQQQGLLRHIAQKRELSALRALSR